MSDSIHITTKDLRNLTKRDLMEMATDPNSVLRHYGKKSLLKKRIEKEREERKTNQ